MNEMSLAISKITNCFDAELIRIGVNDNDSEIVMVFFSELYFDSNLFTFFTLMNVKETVTKVFYNEVIRDFILNLTDRVCLSLLEDNIEFSKLVTLIKGAVKLNRSSDSTETNCLIPLEIRQSIYLNIEVLDDLLSSNAWLVVFYLVLANYQKTQTCQTFTNAILNGVSNGT